MATTPEIITIASSSDFSARVNFLAMKAALDVASEDPNTEHHTQRVMLANDILLGRVNPVQLALLTMTNPTIAAEASVADLGAGIVDGDLEFQIASMWTPLAIARGS